MQKRVLAPMQEEQQLKQTNKQEVTHLGKNKFKLFLLVEP